MILTTAERTDIILGSMGQVEHIITPEVKAELERRGYMVDGNNVVDFMPEGARNAFNARLEQRRAADAAHEQMQRVVGYGLEGFCFIQSPRPHRN
ncbi:hypothetical protein PTE30175_05411 [Pandoraea terrae]|uniref:Uncharacterized protein n=1 Tax=Pandoraea terrae TaxID=1537710 RepID=A0A5E4ZFV2_9BURK|nr:hypothetical protein [Pandoraea terrae]VVE59305.1 hypothetical protein PTE30175_05411 [Pandoraea terrae]